MQYSVQTNISTYTPDIWKLFVIIGSDFKQEKKTQKIMFVKQHLEGKISRYHD